MMNIRKDYVIEDIQRWKQLPRFCVGATEEDDIDKPPCQEALSINHAFS
jgi:hypothetical protein